MHTQLSDTLYFSSSDKEYLEHILQNKLGVIQAGIVLLTQEGSDRAYYRISNDDTSLILMVYGNEKEENDFFIHIQNFLRSIPINVPRIQYTEVSKRWIFLEDLGATHLFNIVHDEKINLFELYKQVIDGIAPLYSKGNVLFREKPFVTAIPFDEHLYKWEHEYFIENFLIRYKQIHMSLADLNNELLRHREILTKYPNKIIHRDLQSKNCMIYKDKIYFIDFQGLRPGLPEYDLASLIYDPYVSLPEEIRNALIEYYYHTYHEQTGEPISDFMIRYYQCAAQRLMQALGAYGYLGMEKQKTHFLQYIAPAVDLLSSILTRNSILPSLLKLLG